MAAAVACSPFRLVAADFQSAEWTLVQLGELATGASQVVLCSRSGRVAKDGATGPWYLLLFETLKCVVQASDVADAAESRLLLGRPCNHLLHAAGTWLSRVIDL